MRPRTLLRGNKIDPSSSIRRETYYRDRAFSLLLISAVLIAFIGFAVEEIVWHYDLWVHRSRMDLAGITRAFLFVFGGYGHSSLWYVVAVLWLPLPYTFVRCYCRSRDDREFALLFLHGFIWCWVLVGFGLVLISIPLLASLIILLQDVLPRSPIRDVVPWVAFGLVLLTFIACVLEFSQRVKHSRRLRMNLCVECGYDLRVSTGRCPECGALSVQKGVLPPG